MAHLASRLRPLLLPLALLAAGCGVPAPAPGPEAAAPPYAALRAERDTAGIRAIKAAIRKHFEVATLDRVVAVKTLAITPAPAWNEFVYEGTMVEDDLETGFFTFKIAGIYDAVAKEVEVKAKELIAFQGVDPRAPRGSGAQR